jgi:hypothetical protein
MPVTLGGDMRLPNHARLRVYRKDLVQLAKNEFITLATIDRSSKSFLNTVNIQDISNVVLLNRINGLFSLFSLFLYNISNTVSGAALLRVILDADGQSNFSYLEACMRLMHAPSNSSQSKTPIFLSSGAEDYFLSASYFDEGLFQVCF